MDEVQKRISRAQAMNCAVQVMQQADKSLPDKEFKELILKWRDWFYEKLNDEEEDKFGTPIPKFDYTKTKDLTDDQYKGFGGSVSNAPTPGYGYSPSVKQVGGSYPKFSPSSVKKGEKKIDLRGEPKSRDVAKDDVEHDYIQEI